MAKIILRGEFNMTIIIKSKKITLILLAAFVLSSIFLIGGPKTIAKASDQTLVHMQNIYHDENDNVNVLFNANLNLLYDYYTYGVTYGTVGEIHVKDLETGIITTYPATVIQQENGIALYKSTFTHPAGHRVLIEIEFISPSMTGKPQSYIDDNNGNWYQCHNWN